MGVQTTDDVVKGAAELDSKATSAEHRTPVGELTRRAAFLGVSVLWWKVTHDAWRLRQLTTSYLESHGRPELHAIPWPDHLRTFHTDLIAVGADYFYPFGALVLIVVGFLWLVVGTWVAIESPRLRRVVQASGVVAIVAQIAVLGPTMGTYITVTD